MEKKEKDCVTHVLVLPSPSQGHVNPMLQFAKRLASKGIKVTIATTVFITKSMQAQDVAVRIESISDGYDEGGPSDAEDSQTYLNHLQDVGSRTLAELIEKQQGTDHPFSYIVYDSFLPWALDVAGRFGLSGSSFWTQSCAVFAVYYYVREGWLNVPVEGKLVSTLGLPQLGMYDLPSFVSFPQQNPFALHTILACYDNLDKADWVLVNTIDELEPEVISFLNKIWRVKAIGPAIPSMYLDKRVKGDSSYGLDLWKPNRASCMKWLDTRVSGSVVYVSYGSLAEIGRDQMNEVAQGLARSNKCFLWVVRASEAHKLPIKFAEETLEKGLLVTWCPQLEVLAHEAVGCFVTHCGWNSTLEALSLGVPMVGVPQWADQPTDAKYVEDVWEVGVRARVDEKGIVTSEEMEKCIWEVMEGEKGKEIRNNALKWKELIKGAATEGGSSDKDMEEFVMEFLSGKTKRS